MINWKDFQNINIFKSLNFKPGSDGLKVEIGGTTTTITPSDLKEIEGIVAASTGNVWFVSSVTGTSGQPGTKAQPKATWDQGQNLASAYDAVILLPGHDETISGADAVDLDTASVRHIGIGRGTAQPRISFDNTAATVGVDAANVAIEGINFEATISAVVKGVDVKDGADDYTIANCRFSSETLGTDEFNDSIFVTTADRGKIYGNYIDMDEGGAQSGIHMVGACLGVDIRDNFIQGDYAVACIEGVTAAGEMYLIRDNVLVNGVHSGLNTLACINLFTGTTGFIQNNHLYTNVTNAETAAISADGCFLGKNYVSTTAESAPLETENLARGRLEVTALAGIELNDEGEASTTFACNGPVDIYGVYGVITTACDETEEISLTLESGTTLMALGEVHTGTAAGDVFFAATAGATPTVDEVGTAEQHIWSNPVRVTGTEDLIDALSEGDIDGGGACTLYVVWSPVVAGAEVAAT